MLVMKNIEISWYGCGSVKEMVTNLRQRILGLMQFDIKAYKIFFKKQFCSSSVTFAVIKAILLQEVCFIQTRED
jgi:hypothetical protein